MAGRACECMRARAVSRLVLEWATRGSMFDLIFKRNEFSKPRDLPRLLRMMAGAAAGLLHLHACSPPIIHRDIALRNLFVTADHQIKASAGRARHHRLLSCLLWLACWFG